MSEQPLQAFSLASLLPPFHEIKLPSAGNWDSSVPEAIHVRALTVKELKHITANGKFDRKVFDNTLSACIKEALDISRITLEDYNYIVYMIRLFSNGSKVSTIKVCDNPACRNQFKFEYDISECASVDYATDAIEKTKTVALPRFLTEHNYNVTVDVKRLTRKDILAIEDTLRIQTELSAKDGSKHPVFPLLEYLKTYIVSISGFPVPLPKEQVLDIFSTEDAELITSAFENVTFGVKGSVKTECPFCHKTNEYEIPFTDVFFL